jgi:sec-independent protein translocase protein TatA
MESAPLLSSRDGAERVQLEGFGPTRNRKVVGSNPTSGSKTAGQRVYTVLPPMALLASLIIPLHEPGVGRAASLGYVAVGPPPGLAELGGYRRARLRGPYINPDSPISPASHAAGEMLAGYLGDEGTTVDDKYLIVILVLAILFGASRLPSLGRNLGQGIREFREGIAEGAQGDDVEKAAPVSPADVSGAAS